jgi:hypothetical protein
MSLAIIENLNGSVVDSRPVNRGVMSPLHINTQLIPAVPQLNDAELVWIMREAG